MIAQARQLVDQFGNPFSSDGRDAQIARLRERVIDARREMVQAKYDAAQTNTDNQGHWANADNLDPHASASLSVRRRLRSRSRYEVLENNPFLKGVLLTVCNDFVGRRGPRLKITDKRLSKERREIIEARWRKWSKLTRLRQKLWRARMAKLVDGESFFRAFIDKRTRHPVKINFRVFETDQVSSDGVFPKQGAANEIDGVRFNNDEQATHFHFLNQHPGSSVVFGGLGVGGGSWVPADFVVHWFRQDRGWLRGIPELTPSLPLCAILRRYTLAMVQWAEAQADITVLLETDGPPATNPWAAGNTGNVGQQSDVPFEIFPIEPGMMMNLPWTYKMKQLQTVPLGTQYDEFVGSVLREVTRPILVPFNLAAGTSKDSNMASSIVDQNIYKGGQTAERSDCEEVVLDQVAELWWLEAVLVGGYFGDAMLSSDPAFRYELPEHEWKWDRVGLDHTDPSKVAKSLETLHKMKVVTDADIQEEYFNRDVDQWRAEVEEQEEWRKTIAPAPVMEDDPEDDDDETDDAEEREEQEQNA